MDAGTPAWQQPNEILAIFIPLSPRRWRSDLWLAFRDGTAGLSLAAGAGAVSGGGGGTLPLARLQRAVLSLLDGWQAHACAMLFLTMALGNAVTTAQTILAKRSLGRLRRAAAKAS